MTTKRKILVVDDDADIREGLGIWLFNSGFETIEAENGEQCLSMVADYSPQAIVLDVRMPVLDGLTTLRRLRSDSRTADIPVVMVSSSLQDEQIALEAGANYFIPKPYEGRKLGAVLKIAIYGKSEIRKPHFSQNRVRRSTPERTLIYSQPSFVVSLGQEELER